MRKYTYNRVMKETGICPVGELLTDKELEKMRRNRRHSRTGIVTERVRVNSSDVYYFFGIRFAE